jgi:hypothetical protein
MTTPSTKLPPPPPYDAAQYYSSALLKAQRPFAHQSSNVQAASATATVTAKFLESDMFEPEKTCPVTGSDQTVFSMDFDLVPML